MPPSIGSGLFEFGSTIQPMGNVVKIECGKWLGGMLLSLAGVQAGAQVQCERVTGINLAGGEFAPQVLPGVAGRDYKFPTLAHMTYYRQLGFDAIRLPILWERLQPAVYSGLDRTYLGHVKTALSNAHQVGLKVVVDLHNYGKYRGLQIGSTALPWMTIYDVWRKLALEIHTMPALYAYGLMNEPNDPEKRGHRAQQVALSAVRTVDRNRLIYVSGEWFSGAHRWPEVNPVPFVSDPVGKEIYEAHLYLDNDASGRYADPSMPAEGSAARVNNRLAPFLEWLNRNGKRGVIGEWGVPANSGPWMPAAQQVLFSAKVNCLSTFVWAGGAWSPNYLLSLEPLYGVEKLLVTNLRSWIPMYK